MSKCWKLTILVDSEVTIHFPVQVAARSRASGQMVSNCQRLQLISAAETCPVQGHILLRGRLQPGAEQAGGIKTSHMGPPGAVWWALAEPSSSDLYCSYLLSACSPSVFSLTCWAFITSFFFFNLKCSWYTIEVTGVQHSNSQFLSYTPFIVILKYWVYSLCCAIYSCSFLYTKYFVS